MFGSRPKVQSWLDTFRKPHLCAVAGLARNMSIVSVTSAESLKPFIRASEDKTRTECWFLVICGILSFLVHTATRFAFEQLGHTKRCKTQEKIYPFIVRPTIEVILEHGPSHLKDGIESDSGEKLNDANTLHTCSTACCPRGELRSLLKNTRWLSF